MNASTATADTPLRQDPVTGASSRIRSIRRHSDRPDSVLAPPARCRL